jgi:hypothetical protein
MEGHREVLKIFGITEITSANTEWFTNPNSFVIIAESQQTGRVIGGARIHVVGGTQPLPIEDAIGIMDPNIYNLVETLGFKGSGELCGLWNAREVAGMGISFLLTKAAISIVNQLKLNTLFIICAEMTYNRIFKNCGFEVIQSLGNNGTFFYPKSDLLAVALIIKDTNLIPKAIDDERNKILDLRKNFQQAKIETGTREPILIEYNLGFSKVWD